MKDGSTSRDPERLFTEAAAAYVGDRIAAWWGAYEALTSSIEQGRLTPKIATEMAKTYDRVVGNLVTGYEPEHWNSGQREPTKPISRELKQFLDQDVLGGRIHDKFSQDPVLQGLVNQGTTPSEAPSDAHEQKHSP
jgi:hypothetical protein